MSLTLGKLMMNGGASVATWTALSAITPLASAYGDAINDRLYFPGGTYLGVNQFAIDEFNPVTGNLNPIGNYDYDARFLAAAAIGTKLYFGGGRDGIIGSEVSRAFWRVYDTTLPLGSSASNLANIPAVAGFPGATVFGGNIYLMSTEGAPNTHPPFYRYNVVANTWTTLNGPTVTPTGVAAQTLGDALTASPTTIYALLTGVTAVSVGQRGRLFKYNTGPDTWTELTGPPGPISPAASRPIWATTYQDGKIWAIAGQPQFVGPSYLFRYDIATDTWDTDPLRSPTIGIETMTSAFVDSGTIRFLGGKLYYVLGRNSAGTANTTPYRRDAGSSGGLA